MKGFSLTELLVTISVIGLLASLLLPVIVKAYRHSKAWIWGCYAFNENRIEAFLDDNKDQWQMYYATNKPVPWSFIR